MANEKNTDDGHTGRIIALIEQELPTTTPAQKNELSVLCAGLMNVKERRIKAQSALFTKRQQFRLPKDKGFTDWDRKIMLDAATTDLQAEYEWYVCLEKTVELRIEVLRQLLI